MKSNVIQFEPAAAAIREVSERFAALNDERRRLFSRLDELRSLTPSLRRRRVRQSPPAMTAPVTFYSIEEAEASESAPLTAA